MKNNRLSFAKGNAKLGKDIAIFSLPAGHTCPGALLCLSKANQLTGKLTDGAKTQFRCYAASAENLFKNIRKSRWNNLRQLQRAGTTAEMAALIIHSLPQKNTSYVRIHSSGDFFNQAYFDAWLLVAKAFPGLTFYVYTKMLPLWVARLGSIPANFKLVASQGGVWDRLIEKHGLRNVKVVFSEQEAKDLGIPIDHDDSLAYKTDSSFALLLHGVQMAKSEAMRAVYQLRKQGKGGYKSDYFKHYDKIKSLQAA